MLRAPAAPRALSSEAGHPGPEPQAVGSAFPPAVRGPGQGTSHKPAWADGVPATSATAAPGPPGSTCALKRRRKPREPGLQRGQPAPCSAKRTRTHTRVDARAEPPRPRPSHGARAPALGSGGAAALAPRLRCPKVDDADLEGSEEEEEEEEGEEGEETGPGRRGPSKRLLPDRTRAARDRAKQKLADFIVKTHGADAHLRDILRGRKPSRWLAAFLRADGKADYTETYLEDEEQLFTVAKYLQRVYEQTRDPVPPPLAVDKVRVVLEVLLPEAVICSLAALGGMDPREAEEEFMRGSPVHYRKRALFDREVSGERRRRPAAARRWLLGAPS